MEQRNRSDPWEAFLTARDKKHLELRPQQSSNSPGSSPALLLIDLYRSIFGESPRPLLEAVAAGSRSSCGLEAWEALPKIQSLLVTAREAGRPVIHTTGSTNLPRRSEVNVSLDADEERRRAQGYEFMEEIKPQPGELVIKKTAPSAFWGTPLIAYLTSQRIDTVVVVGASTSGCVRATVVEARSHRLNAVVVQDCVIDRHELSHAANLFDMRQKYAKIVDAVSAQELLRVREQVTGD